MYRALFRSWKFAALWAIGISASTAAFFAEGGGHEQLEESAQQIREKRNPHREPVVATTPTEPTTAETEPAESEFGEPEMVSEDGESQPAPSPQQQPAGDEEAFQSETLNI